MSRFPSLWEGLLGGGAQLRVDTQKKIPRGLKALRTQVICFSLLP